MTRYEQGFLTKCAEYGIEPNAAVCLMEKSAVNREAVDMVSRALKNRNKLSRMLVNRHPGVSPYRIAEKGTEIGVLEDYLSGLHDHVRPLPDKFMSILTSLSKKGKLPNRWKAPDGRHMRGYTAEEPSLAEAIAAVKGGTLPFSNGAVWRTDVLKSLANRLS